MKKKILLSIFMVLFVLCMVGAASCGKSDPALKDWTDETIELGYGQTYTLDLAVEAEDGESYAVTASVKTKDGETVDIVNGAFIANEKTEYIVTYVCVVEEKEYTRTVTIKVVAAAEPVINIYGNNSPLIPGMTFTIPSARAFDYFDGELSYTVKLIKKTSSGDKEVDFNKEEGVYEVAEVGEFYLLYSAVNSNDIEGTAKFEFEVVSPESLKDILVVTEETQGDVYNVDVVDQAYVASNAMELSTISGDYDGNAKKFKIWTNANYNLKCNYSAELVEEMANTYNSLTMWIAVTGLTSQSSGDAYMMQYAKYDEETGTTISADTIQTLATGGTLGLIDKQNQWIKLVVPSERAKELITNGEFIKLFNIWVDGVDNSNAFVYVGDVKFENVSEIPELPKPDEPTEGIKLSYSDFGATEEQDKDAWTMDGITGSYEGLAIKSGGINSNFRYRNPWGEEELETIKETYDTVTLNIAFKFTGGYAHFYDNYGFYGLCADADLDVSETAGNVGQWFAWSMSIEDYVTLVSATNYVDFQVFHVFGESYTNFFIYFGELTLSDSQVAKPIEPIKKSVISYSDFGATEELDKVAWTADGIIGDYDGVAVKSAGVNPNFRLVNPWSEDELVAAKKTYDTVTLNIAFKLTGGYAHFYDNYGFYGYCADADLDVSETAGNVGQWFAWTMSIEDYIALVSTSNYADFQVFHVYAEGYADFSIYFGELTLSSSENA